MVRTEAQTSQTMMFLRQTYPQHLAHPTPQPQSPGPVQQRGPRGRPSRPPLPLPFLLGHPGLGGGGRGGETELRRLWEYQAAKTEGVSKEAGTCHPGGAMGRALFAREDGAANSVWSSCTESPLWAARVSQALLEAP